MAQQRNFQILHGEPIDTVLHRYHKNKCTIQLVRNSQVSLLALLLHVDDTCLADMSWLEPPEVKHPFHQGCLHQCPLSLAGLTGHELDCCEWHPWTCTISSLHLHPVQATVSL